MRVGDASKAPNQKASETLAEGHPGDFNGQQVITVLSDLLATARKLTGAGVAAAFLGDSNYHVTDVARAGFPDSQLEVAPGLDEFFADLLAGPRPLLLDDVRADRSGYRIPPWHPSIAGMVGAPVQPRRGPPGYLYVAHEDEDRRFSSDDAETVTALASAAALVLDTYRLVTNGPERLRWLDAIAELIHLLHGDIGREEGLQGIADLLRKAASADTAVIVLSERAEGDAQAAIEAASGLGADLMQGASLSRGHFLTVVMESGRAVLTDDVPNMRSALPTPSEWLEALSVLGPGLFVPLGTQVQTVGALFVAWRRDSPHGRHAADVSTLAIPFAQATTLVLQRHETARLHARQQRWMATGAEITRSLLTEVEPQAVMSQVTRQIRDISGAAFAAVILTDHIGPRGTVRFDVIDGLGLEDASGSRVPCPSPLDIVIESGQPIITSDLVRDERYRPPSMWREALSVLGLTMLVPLRAPQEVQGVLVVGWERGSPEERAARNDAPLVESFADQIALSLQQTRVCQDRERRQSWLDAFGDLTRRLANDAEQEANLEGQNEPQGLPAK